MPNGVRGVLFDAGNTLVYIDPVRMVEIFRAEGVETDVPSFRSAELTARHTLHARIEEGSTGTEPELWGEYFLRLFSLCGVPEASLDAVSERVRVEHARDHLWTYSLPGTGAVLEALKGQGYRVGVISNADGRMEGALARAGVRSHVEFVIDSGKVGVEKPGAEIFHAGCDAIGLEPAECVYVGDLFPVDYVGAKSAGLGAVLLDPLGVHEDRAETVGALGELEAWLNRDPSLPFSR